MNSGDIRNFVQCNVINDRTRKPGFYKASIHLREELGTAGLRASSGNFTPQQPTTPHIEESKGQRFERLSTSTYLADKFKPIREIWAGAKEAVSGYLLTRRGITKETQAYFRNGFRCEGEKTHDGQNKGGIMFQMTDYARNLYGTVRRGPTTMLNKHGEVVPFNKMAYGSERHAVILGDAKTAERIYVCEAPIDGMSRAQMDGIPQGGPKSAVVAIAGSAAEGPLSVIYAIAKDRGAEVEWHHVRQNDVPNEVGQIMDEVYGAKIREAITEGYAAAKIEDRRPDPHFKDSNDELRGLSRPIPQTAEQQQASFEARQEAKARREGYGAPEPTPPAPRGPEMGGLTALLEPRRAGFFVAGLRLLLWTLRPLDHQPERFPLPIRKVD